MHDFKQFHVKEHHLDQVKDTSTTSRRPKHV
jgi:hypothetical protein